MFGTAPCLSVYMLTRCTVFLFFVLPIVRIWWPCGPWSFRDLFPSQPYHHHHPEEKYLDRGLSICLSVCMCSSHILLEIRVLIAYTCHLIIYPRVLKRPESYLDSQPSEEVRTITKRSEASPESSHLCELPINVVCHNGAGRDMFGTGAVFDMGGQHRGSLFFVMPELAGTCSRPRLFFKTMAGEKPSPV